jgi:hypothetical protein
MPGVSPHRMHLDVPLTLQVGADEVVTRATRLGDGWMPIMASMRKPSRSLGALREELSLSMKNPQSNVHGSSLYSDNY